MSNELSEAIERDGSLLGPMGNRLSPSRAAKTQALFREVNERLKELQPTASTIDFICECADDTCTDQISATQQEYEAVRQAGGNRFLVRHGHVFPELEHVVEDGNRFQVVEKLGEAAAAARKLDPRTRMRANPV
jgi:hypothetical protein